MHGAKAGRLDQNISVSSAKRIPRSVSLSTSTPLYPISPLMMRAKKQQDLALYEIELRHDLLHAKIARAGGAPPKLSRLR
jgi:hypothetical protein